MTSIVTKTISEQVADYIKGKLKKGELAPGDRVTELSIAKHLSVSQPPVREAMQILAAEGIIETIGKRGKHITLLTPKAIRDSYFTGGAIEAAVVSNSLPDFTQDHFDRISEIVETMKKKSLGDPDIDTLADLDVAFHRCLFSVSGNDIAMQLWFRSCQVVGKYLFYKRWKEMHSAIRIYERHFEILEVLKSGDQHQVRQILMDHYIKAGLSIAQYAKKYDVVK